MSLRFWDARFERNVLFFENVLVGGKTSSMKTELELFSKLGEQVSGIRKGIPT